MYLWVAASSPEPQSRKEDCMYCLPLCLWFELCWVSLYLFVPKPYSSAEFCEDSNRGSLLDLMSSTSLCLASGLMTDAFGTCLEHKRLDLFIHILRGSPSKRTDWLHPLRSRLGGRLGLILTVLEGNVLIPAWCSFRLKLSGAFWSECTVFLFY